MTSKITLTGAIVGQIWQPGAGMCGKHLHVELTRIAPRDVSKVRRDLFQVVADVLNDGDFQSAYLSADSFFTVTRETRSGDRRIIRERVIAVEDLPSIAELVDADTYAGDFLT